MSRNLGKDVSTVLAETNIHDVLNEHLQCGKGGVSVRDYTCPFHELGGHADDSFSLNGLQTPDQPGKFRCSACGARGNAIDFLILYHRFTIEQAVKSLMKPKRGESCYA